MFAEPDEKGVEARCRRGSLRRFSTEEGAREKKPERREWREEGARGGKVNESGSEGKTARRRDKG